MTGVTTGTSESAPIEPVAPASCKSWGYRWFTALLLLNLIGAGVYYWYYHVHLSNYDAIAAERVYAIVRIQGQRPTLMYRIEPSDTERDFPVYKETQARLVKSRFVLAAALRRPGIKELQLLKPHAYPLEWLEQHLEVDFPAEEFMRISLDAPKSEEAADLVNSVYESYLRDVVDADQAARKARRNNLEDIHRGIEDKLRTKSNAVRKLAEALSSGDSEAISLKQQLAIERFELLRKHLAELEFELIRAGTELEMQRQTTAPGEKQIERAAHNDPFVVELTVERDVLQEMIAQQQAKPTEGDDQEPEPPRMQEQTLRLQAIEAVLARRLTQLKETAAKQVVGETEQELQRKVELLESRVEQLREQTQSQEVVAKRIGIESFELESLRDDIKQIKSVADSLAAEIQKLDIELGAPPRVTAYQGAALLR